MSTTDDEQDRRLARRARLGDERAFAELVDRHRGPLVRWVARRSGRPELAEDAVQEGLIAAHRALRAGDGSPTDVRAWLHTIAWRRAVDLVRRERPAAALGDDVVAVPGPETTVLLALELDRVVAAWTELPGRQREALRMSALEGRSLEEIGAALGVNAGAAKALVARGRRTLTARLSTDELRCDDVRAQVLDATGRGVRLGADAGRHLRECRACAKAHRVARRRRRLHAALLSPPVLLINKLRDYVFAIAGHEPQVSLATKVCAGACATALAGGIAAAPVATSSLVVSGGAVFLASERPASVRLPARDAPARKRDKPRHAALARSATSTTGTTTTTATATATTSTTATARAGAKTVTPRVATATAGTSAVVATATTTTANAPTHRPAELARTTTSTVPSARIARGPDGESAPSFDSAQAEPQARPAASGS